MRILLILLMLVVPAQVFAGNTYVKGNVGIFMFEDSSISANNGVLDVEVGDLTASTGFGLSAAVGRGFDSGFDIELEYGYKHANFEDFKLNEDIVDGIEIEIDGSVNIKTLMVNGIYNFKNISFLTPYVGAGIGIGWVSFEDEEKFSDTKLAYQVLAGVETGITERLSFLVGYKYLGTGDFMEEEGEIDVLASIDSHNIEFGLKYSF